MKKQVNKEKKHINGVFVFLLPGTRGKNVDKSQKNYIKTGNNDEINGRNYIKGKNKKIGI